MTVSAPQTPPPERQLFSPFHLRGLELSNRIAVSPMCQYSAVDGMPQPWHLMHLGGLALSGAGLVIAEATAVEARGRISKGCLGLWSDAQEAALSRLLGDIGRVSSAKIGVQLGHAGRKASCRSIFERWKGESLPPEEGAWPTIAPTATPFDEGWHRPLEATEADILGVIEAFAAAARRAVRAGFHLIEIHAAHGYLIHEFLSPLTNLRSDRWGGSVENRNRLAVEVARAVRAAVPEDYPVGFRLTGTDWHRDGLTLDDAVELARALKAEGVDYAVMSAGNIAPVANIPRTTLGHQVEFAARVRRETGLPTMAVGFILSAEQAEDILQQESADLIAIGRGFLDDPRWAWHAAATLGVDIEYPDQYVRARPNNWGGYSHVHGETVVHTTRQADRPPSAAWDRPAQA